MRVNPIHLLHFAPAIFAVIPIVVLISMIKKSGKDVMRTVFVLMVVGFIPLVVYHSIHGLMAFDIHLLEEGTLINNVLEHVVVVIALLSVTGGLVIFKKRFIDPIYGR